MTSDNDSCANVIQNFQNCRESDVKGYNDCPTFLLDLNNTRSKKGSYVKRKQKSSLVSARILHDVKDTFRSAKIVDVVPPPSSAKNRFPLIDADNKRTELTDKSPVTESAGKVYVDENNSIDPIEKNNIKLLTDLELIGKLNEMVASPSGLPLQEFKFYSSKLLRFQKDIVQNQSARPVLCYILEQQSIIDSKQLTKLLNKWVMSDSSISSWFPAFRKIIENIQ
ncbi:Add37p SCDLUD_001152 [Saccharomycodes ludwigii]|uniref:Add37p n=1 Tax=Saccharomycodes ludwigii TaxID=36035 RepID=UPI001E83F95B|nr:hypothetical protein SCDLUD_001152 [Saccharomycodes ludwigii]KAH3903511.1 hypothetical protein SCDLUD_001152 [Saccharomycodes ludwigii]